MIKRPAKSNNDRQEYLYYLLSSCLLFIVPVNLLAAPEPAPQAPMAYFEESCARCHGSLGSFYGDDFGRKLTPAAMRTVIKEMVEGPARSSLSDGALDVQTAFHLALARHEPFLAWTSVTSTTLQGEATPEATVTATRLNAADTTLTLHRDQWRWILPLPDGLSPADIELRATIPATSSTTKTTTTVLRLADRSFSHGDLATSPTAAGQVR